MNEKWEHWCHCHEMYLQLNQDEICPSCGRDKPDILDEEHYFRDEITFTSSPDNDKIEPQT